MSSYSKTVMEHFHRPRNVGPPDTVTHEGVAGRPEDGPFTVIYLEIANEIIREAGFRTYGCAPAIAAGSLLTEELKGRPWKNAEGLNAQWLLAHLGGLPAGKRFCADLAVRALKDALQKIKTSSENP